MPYDIFGYVEAAPRAPGPWRAAFILDEIAGHPDDFSRTVFGLAKWAEAGSAPLAERGLPDNVSDEVREWMASTAQFEEEEGNSGEHGHTHATMAELRAMAIAPDSPWQTVLTRIAELQNAGGYADTEVRVVVWGNY